MNLLETKILENLEVLRAAVIAEPEALFDLHAFARITDCGTLHCTLGLACTMSYFKEQGLRFNEFSFFSPRMEGENHTTARSFDKLFGEFSYDRLFTSAGCGTRDKELGFERNYFLYRIGQSMTDKELAIARLDAAIATYKEEV